MTNLSISTGVYPKKLKIAKIIPIFKLDDNNDSNKYRPISLPTNFNRIFEKQIFNRMASFIEKKKICFLPLYMVSTKPTQLTMQF